MSKPKSTAKATAMPTATAKSMAMAKSMAKSKSMATSRSKSKAKAMAMAMAKSKSRRPGGGDTPATGTARGYRTSFLSVAITLSIRSIRAASTAPTYPNASAAEHAHLT